MSAIMYCDPLYAMESPSSFIISIGNVRQYSDAASGSRARNNWPLSIPAYMNRYHLQYLIVN